LIGVGAALLLPWLALLIALLVARPGGNVITESLRLMPDLLRLVARLARDHTLPRGVRVRLGLLLAYRAFPLDLIPDVVPVLGYADDVIVVLWALRSVLPAAGRIRSAGTGLGHPVLSKSCSALPGPSGTLTPNPMSPGVRMTDWNWLWLTHDVTVNNAGDDSAGVTRSPSVSVES